MKDVYTGYIWKELIKRKSRTATIVLTVAVLTSMLLLLSGVINAYSSSIYLPFEGINSDIVLQKSGNATSNFSSNVRVPFGRGLFNESETNFITKLSHVNSLSQSLVIWEFGKSGFTSIEGIEPDSVVGQKLASEITEGGFLTTNGTGKAVLEKHFAKFHSLKVGSNITLGDTTFNVIGILAVEETAQLFSSNVYLTFPETEKLSNTNGCDQIYLKIDSLSNEEWVRDKILQLDDNITAFSGNTISASLSNMVNIFSKFQYIGASLVALIVALVLVKITTVNLLERKRDIAIMQSVGWTKKEISGQIVAEFVIQTIGGFIFGLIASFVIVSLFGTISIETVTVGLNKSTITVPIRVSAFMILEYFAAVLIISVFVAYLLTRKISAMKPSENFKI